MGVKPRSLSELLLELETDALNCLATLASETRFFLFNHLILQLELYYFFELRVVGDCLPLCCGSALAIILNLMLQTVTGYQI